jgi:hypothetical protein
LKLAHNFTLSGIALGTVVAVGGYHLARLVAPDEPDEGTMIAVGAPGAHVADPQPATAAERDSEGDSERASERRTETDQE